MPIVYPDYNRSILSLISSILAYYGTPSLHPSLPQLDMLLRPAVKNTVLILLDGMGSSLLERNLPADSFMRSHKIGDLSSVYPCTTAAATTSLMSGLSPLEHGWLGWTAWFREYGRIVDLFLDRDSFSGTPVSPSPAKTLLPFEDIVTKIMRVQAGTLRPHRIMPPFDPDGVDSAARMAGRIKEACRLDGRQLVLAYWHEPDTLAHNEGPASEAVRQEVLGLDRLLGELFADLPGTRVIITADHGQVEITREIALDDLPGLADCLILPPTLEGRAASLFVKPGRLVEFAGRFQEALGDDFLLLPRQEVFDKGLFGSGTPHRKVDDFIGDFLACATGSAMIRWRSLFGRPHNTFRGHHSGLCREEMIVPLIFAENR